MTPEAPIRDALSYVKAIKRQKEKAVKAVKASIEDIKALETMRENAAHALYEANMNCSSALEEFLQNLQAHETQEEKYSLALEELLRLKDLS